MQRICLLLCLLAQGCTTPSADYLASAMRQGFDNQLVAGSPYRHRLFLNHPAERQSDLKTLHVYLDGDGTPWSMGQAAADPTPRNRLILALMAQDAMPALLLGRPCYYGLNTSLGCEASLWTSHRYSKAVVTSMSAALQNWLAGKKIDRLVLIGFSGGGSLATLLAEHLPATAAVVTIAANLDIEAWSRHHGYLPPEASLNPIRDAHIAAHIRQYHLAGLQDENVPAEIIESFYRTQKNAEYLPLTDYDHACCWPAIWPAFLKQRLDGER